MYQHILVPIDGSELAERALREAVQLARLLSARMRIMHILSSTPWITQGSPEVMEEFITQMRSTGESIIREATIVARSADIQVDDRLIEAIGERAAKYIVAEANDWPAELIVCGTHGRSGLSRLLMGSDAEYIVRHSPVPVLLIRASA